MLQKTAKTQTQFHQEVKCHTKRSFHPTNQAKCRACYVLSTCWLFSASLRRKTRKKNEFILIGQKLQLMQHPNCKSSKTLKSNRDIKSSCKNFTSVKEMFQKHHISSQTSQNCMASSEIETGKRCLPKTLVLHGYAAKTTVNKCDKSTKPNNCC